MKSITLRIQDGIYDRMKERILRKAINNGKDLSINQYITDLILKDIDLPTIASETAPAKDTKSNQPLMLGDLFDL